MSTLETDGVGENGDPVVPLLLGAEWVTDQPGGLPRYLADLFDALRTAGLRPRATVAGPAEDAPVGVAAGGHFAHFAPLRLWRFALAAGRSSHGIDVVDAHFAFYAFLPVVLGRLRRLPLVVHFQGPWAGESLVIGETGWRVWAKKRLETAVYRRARAVVVLSGAFKDVLVADYGLAPWTIHVVPPGVDLDRLTPGDRSAARARLDLPADAPVAVAVRRLVPRMGLDVLLEGWAKVQSAAGGGSARLVVVGDGPERGRLRELAVRLGVEDSVRFLGAVDDDTVVECYRAADVSVVPSVALEGFGLVVIESLACGTPAIVTDSGGLPDGVRGLDPSAVVPAGDAGALAARLAGALDGTEPLPDRARCRSHATSFGWPAVAHRHRAIYTEAVRHPEPRRLRVVYLDHCAQLSGGELALLRLLPALGDEVDAHVVLGEDGPLVDRLRRAGLSVEVFEIAAGARRLRRDRVRPGRLPVSAAAQTVEHTARLARRLRRLRPDLVHTNSLKAALYGGTAARMASIPAIWHIRDRITDDYLPAPARRLVHLSSRLLPTAVIANSAATLATLGTGAGGTVIPSPIASVSAQRHPRGDAGASFRVGMVGRLAPWKGQHVFLEAFARAFPDGPEEAVIVGDALFGEEAYRADLDRLVQRRGLSGRVEFRGFRDDVAEELARLDVLVHASTIPEPFGQVVVEGMAAGLAVVAADAGGPAEVVADGVDGLLYPMGDVVALGRRMLDLAADPGLRRRLGERARSTAAAYTADRIATSVLEVYRSVLAAENGGRRQPGATVRKRLRPAAPTPPGTPA